MTEVVVLIGLFVAFALVPPVPGMMLNIVFLADV
jgi:hypothetical protein